MCHSQEMSYFDAQIYEAGKAYSWRNNQFLRLVMSSDAKFDPRIVCELVESKSICGFESTNYSVLI